MLTWNGQTIFCRGKYDIRNESAIMVSFVLLFFHAFAMFLAVKNIYIYIPRQALLTLIQLLQTAVPYR
jgi:hypothetical protein